MRARLRIATGALIKVSSGFRRSGQWAMVLRLEPALWVASSAATFAKPSLNYLHGTPQSLDQATRALAITVLPQTETNREGQKNTGEAQIEYKGRRDGQMGNFIPR